MWMIKDGALTNGRVKLSLYEGEAEDKDLIALAKQLNTGAALQENAKRAFVTGWSYAMSLAGGMNVTWENVDEAWIRYVEDEDGGDDAD